MDKTEADTSAYRIGFFDHDLDLSNNYKAERCNWMNAGIDARVLFGRKKPSKES